MQKRSWTRGIRCVLWAKTRSLARTLLSIRAKNMDCAVPCVPVSSTKILKSIWLKCRKERKLKTTTITRKRKGGAVMNHMAHEHPFKIMLHPVFVHGPCD